jgi:exopolysaccharide biosynthesis polyprenyl glycosylphosphotransferase
MLKQKAALVRNCLIISDGFLVLIAFFIAYQVRLLPYFQSIILISPLGNYLWLTWIAIPLWVILLYSQGLYRSLRTIALVTIIGRIFRVILVGTLILSSLVFIFQAKDFSRSLIGLFAILNFILMVVSRVIIDSVSHSIRKRGYNFRNVAIIGINNRCFDLIKRIKSHPEWSLRVIGVIGIETNDIDIMSAPSDVPCLGTLEDLNRLFNEHVIDEIIITLDKSDLMEVEDTIHLCEELGIRTHLVADFFNLIIARTQLGYLEEIPLLTFTTTPYHDFHLLIKRLLDLFVSTLVIVAGSPFFVAINILIRLDSKGPVMFSQERVGLNGRRFRLLKFRSMIPDAEEKKSAIQDLNEMSGPVFKISNDPRITRIGRILRRYSLDEFPQFFNVFKGDMSLVGPRPPVPEEVEKYVRWQRRRLSMKPGMTCIWQISGRNEIDFEEWMKLDLQYIDHWSLGLDMKILLKTIPAVLSGKGAR